MSNVGVNDYEVKITAIKPYPVWVGTRNQMLVKVETDQGIFGWGESGRRSREGCGRCGRTLSRISHRPRRVQIGRIWQEVYRSQYFEGGRFCRRRFPP